VFLSIGADGAAGGVTGLARGVDPVPVAPQNSWVREGHAMFVRRRAPVLPPVCTTSGVRPVARQAPTGVTLHPTPELGRCLCRHPQVDVFTWRLCWLVDAGFDRGLAEHLAAAPVDLHALLELVDRGCPPVLAARILAPFDEGP
jgi:hypothetical protein